MHRTVLPALAALLAAFGALFAILHAGHPVQEQLAHSDALYLPVLFDDLLRNGGSLRDWYLTPAPYFFPDFPLYLLAWLASSAIPAQTTAFALLQTLLMACAVHLLARKVTGPHAWPATALLAPLLAWLGLHAGDPFLRLYGSAHHYGAFLCTLLLAALWLGPDDNGRQPARAWWTGAAGALLACLTTLSDALFLVQSVAPLALALLLCGGTQRLAARLARMTLLLALPSVLGMWSYRHVVAHPTRYEARLSLARLPENLAEFGRILAGLFGQQRVLAAVILLALLAGLVCGAACLRRKPAPILPRALLGMLVFSTLSCAATVTVMLLSQQAPPAPRYLIAPLSLPLVAGAFLLAYWLGAGFRPVGLGLGCVFAGLLAFDAWQVRHADNGGRYFYPEQVACIDGALAQSNARHGVAQYWDAKQLQALSRHRPTMAQYTGDLAPMEWITSQRFFQERYDFAIIAGQEVPFLRLPRAQLVAVNGEPLRSVTCGNREVLLYGPGRLRMPPPLPAPQ